MQPNKRIPEATKVQVCALAEIDRRPASQVAQMVGISKTSVLRIYRAEKYFPYKAHSVQNLFYGDPEQRMQFCEHMTELVNNDEPLLSKILFTDEATVELSGSPNKQNFRIWSRSNTYYMVENKTQYRAKINVWPGIIGNQIIGPFFIDGNLNGQKYLQLLQEQVLPALMDVEENVSELKMYYLIRDLTESSYCIS